MSSFVDDISGTASSNNADAFNEFFGELGTPPPAKFKKIPAQIPIPSLNSLSHSYCSSWVKDQNFCLLPIDTQQKSPEFSCSPLSESVHDCIEFRNKKRRISERLEPEFAVPRVPPRKSTSSFFQELARAEMEIQEKSPNWRQVNGVWCENPTAETEESTSSDGSISRYQEVMSLFEDNPRLFESVSFDYSYKFDWDRFSQNNMQYVVFTKICQSHPEGEIVEMSKENKKCSNCESSNLAISVRLTVPLDLSETPIPCFEDIEIHVAFPVEKLLEESGWDSLEIFEKSIDFSKEKCEKMHNLYEMLMRGRQSAEYTEWFNKCRVLIKKSLHSKRLFLTLGRVVRRKIEDTQETKKRRCFLFASIFNLELV